MLLDSFLLVLGLTLLLGGGNFLVTGASALARNLGVSPLVIGLTVVAFGTSAPELSINLLGALQGNAGISFGNIIGSNIANIGLVIGLTALIRPLTIQSVIISREIPMMILVSIIALIAGSDLFLRDAAGVFDRSDGLVFLMLFSVFMYYTIGDVIRKRSDDSLVEEAQEFSGGKGLRGSVLNFGMFTGGLAGLLLGGKLSVDAAVGIAEALDISEVVIGLTVVAIGTSLPELVTSLVATFQGKTDIAVGNVVGSNIFNLLLVNGLCSSITPIAVPSGGIFDLLIMILLALFLLPMSITDGKKVVRWEGAVLLALYLGYNIWRVVG